MNEEEMKQTLLNHCKECHLREYASCVECEEKFAKATNKALCLIDKLQKDLENLKEVERQICDEELITKDKYQDILKENEELKELIDELAKENEKWIDSGLDYVKRHFKDYIHKDKIRAKIEELEASLDGCYQANEEVNAGISIDIYTELLIWLKELLEDN